MQLEENQERIRWLDDKIDCTGGEAADEGPSKVRFEEVVPEKNGKKRSFGGNNNSMSLTQPEEHLTDPHTQLEDYLTDPVGSQAEMRRVSASPPSEKMLQSKTPPGLQRSAPTTQVNNPVGVENRGGNANPNPFGDLWNPRTNQLNNRQATNNGVNTLDKYFVREQPSDSAAVESRVPASINGGQLQRNNEASIAQNGSHPWSERMMHHLRNTFGISKFRGHQHEIINATLSGRDAFVVMRTGGGKSLTYQLPAVLESERQRKVTVVISPLISLIRDQEEQMNQIRRGSALSFTSGMAGGTSEHARRWGLVRDPGAGVALIFVTPEKVSKSNKFKGEMEKLHQAGRLGRYVIDEW